jgi:hypothetical protein
LRRISRLIVEGARQSSAAIDRIELPATTPREISSRSIKVNADLERCRSVGLIPPVSARMRCIDEWNRSNNPAIWWMVSPLRQRSQMIALWLAE